MSTKASHLIVRYRFGNQDDVSYWDDANGAWDDELAKATVTSQPRCQKLMSDYRLKEGNPGDTVEILSRKEAQERLRILADHT